MMQAGLEPGAEPRILLWVGRVIVLKLSSCDHNVVYFDIRYVPHTHKKKLGIFKIYRIKLDDDIS